MNAGDGPCDCAQGDGDFGDKGGGNSCLYRNPKPLAETAETSMENLVYLISCRRNYYVV